MDLVGGIPTPLKNISQLGWLFLIYGKIKMFQTTNQIYNDTSPYLMDKSALNYHVLWFMVDIAIVNGILEQFVVFYNGVNSV